MVISLKNSALVRLRIEVMRLLKLSRPPSLYAAELAQHRALSLVQFTYHKTSVLVLFDWLPLLEAGWDREYRDQDEEDAQVTRQPLPSELFSGVARDRSG